MKCPNCNSEEVFRETINRNGDYYLECPNCGVHFINTTQLSAKMDESCQRESFAAMAMLGILSSQQGPYVYIPEDAANKAVKYADALIAELKKGNN